MTEVKSPLGMDQMNKKETLVNFIREFTELFHNPDRYAKDCDIVLPVFDRRCFNS